MVGPIYEQQTDDNRRKKNFFAQTRRFYTVVLCKSNEVGFDKNNVADQIRLAWHFVPWQDLGTDPDKNF